MATNHYANSVAWTAVTPWAATTAYSIGDLRRQLATPTAGNERVFRCTTAGTSGGSEPTWVLTKGATTNDSGVLVWTEVTGQEAYIAPGAWAAPHARIENASAWAAAGDTVYYSSNHAQTLASVYTAVLAGTLAAPCRYLCVEESGSGHIPPTSADLKTGASLVTTGSSPINIGSLSGLIQGLLIWPGSNGSTAANTIGSATQANDLTLRNCVLKTGLAGQLALGLMGSSYGNRLTLENTQLNFPNAGATLTFAGEVLWKNTPSALQGTIPTTLIVNTQGACNDRLVCDGVDLSAAGSGKTLVGALSKAVDVYFQRCKIDAAVTVSAAQTFPGANVWVIGCDSGYGTWRNEIHNCQGDLTTELTTVRTTGASDGVTPYSWKMATNANARKDVNPFRSFPIAIPNDVITGSVVLTAYGIWNGAGGALPNNDDCWMEIEYLGDASSPMASFATDGKADCLASASAQTSDSSTWGAGSTTKFSMSKTITAPAQAGPIIVTLCVGTPSVTVFYDPAIIKA